ncbi:MAG: AAA family ATPase [Vicingaceae bacterium]|nr:AAA family ATPase [Vicingaceae bacterium]
MEKLRQKFYEKYALTQTETVRDFINTIDWQNRFVGIKGSRGVGKTTILLQYIKQHYQPNNDVLYVSLDDLYFSENNLYNLADIFYKKGGKLLAVDEVHRYPNWANELKNIYDDFPSLKVIFTGSSLLHLQHAKADLSRRTVMYQLSGLSFREFLYFETKQSFPILSLEDIFTNHVALAIQLINGFKPLSYFDDYLKYGYYPFYNENKNSFHQKLSETILTILEVDIPQFASIQTTNIIYLKKLLQIISGSVPFKPNMNALSERTGISLNTMKIYLKLLHDAQLLQLLYVQNKGINSLNKPEKIYLNNTNLMFNQGNENVNTGNLRETFFLNQLSSNYVVNSSNEADFLVANKFTFETGGKTKSKKQIKNIANAYVVRDNIEIGSNNMIPLWLFGFLY